MMKMRLAEIGHVLPKLTLTEIFPLFPFLMTRDRLNVVEVGGNVGLWCESFFGIYGDRVADYQVFEPLPGNMAQFRDRMEHTIQHGGQITLNQLCAGNSNDDVTLHFDNDVTALASILLSSVDLGGNLHENDRSMVVPQVRLDDRLTKKTDLIKIDTEGYEWAVLAGAEASLKSGLVDNVFMEFGFHQNALGQSFRQFHEFFHDLGYQVYRQECLGDFFGFHRVDKSRWYDETIGRQYMILASRHGPHPDYRGPTVTGQPRRLRQIAKAVLDKSRRITG